MTSADFDRQFDRLTGHFHLPVDASRETIGVDWFQAVQHLHVDALERGITALIRDAHDRYWPALGKLTDAIKGSMAGRERVKQACTTCQGTTWIDALPWKSNGRVYTGFQRCPDCGTPAPSYTPPRGRDELTAAEYQAWRDGTFAEPPIPVSQSNHDALLALRALQGGEKRGRMLRITETVRS